MYTEEIPQPDPLAPEGKPFVVRWDENGIPHSLAFADENDAWDFRDELLNRGMTGVRVTGAPCRVTVVGIGEQLELEITGD